MKFRWQFEDDYKVTVEADSAQQLAQALRENPGMVRVAIERELRAVLALLEGREPEKDSDVVDGLRARRYETATAG